MNQKRLYLILLIILLPIKMILAQGYMIPSQLSGSFTLSAPQQSAPIYVNQSDFPGVLRALRDLQVDITAVSQTEPKLLIDQQPAGGEVVIVGTIGKSKLVDDLVSRGKLNVGDVAGKWETFVTAVIEKPMPGVDRALVIAGSDKRGTIFGIYELSKQIGVSPWYWWADVPIQKQSSLLIKAGRYVQGEPVVKYRGIFINDEEPALGRWAVEKYGGFNHAFYGKVFELILRMKGNYLWPAMWWAAFNADDSLNAQMADEYGIVMGTTHHEPMNRAHAEWRKTGKGPWNYDTNPDVLKAFWKEGIEKIGSRETIVSLGMRGDGDMAMSRETNVALLQKIVSDQRDIITSVTKKDIKETPQLWALYKEVQDYYDQGMRAPDDVTLLLCDDNWGNIRKLPKLEDSLRAGGYGIYYHFDYVGGPRNYKWVNTNPITRVWEQMHLAYRYGANRIWIVNVGDIKPMEFPTEFFLDYAWNPELWNQDNLDKYTYQWASRQFGDKYAYKIANVISLYTQYNARRKPELLSADTYSLVNYDEAETVVRDYNKLVVEAERIQSLLPAEFQDAYFQLVLHPVKASAKLNELWVTVAKNRFFAQQGRAAANALALKAQTLFDADAELSKQYNGLGNGKWNHLMDQTHISYTHWQQPQKDALPEVKQVDLLEKGEMGVSIEGSTQWWPQEKSEAILPIIDYYNNQSYYVEIFNRGKAPFNYSISKDLPWIKLSTAAGKVDQEVRVEVTVDWSIAPKGDLQSAIVISDEIGNSIKVKMIVRNPAAPRRDHMTGYAESDGYVSIPADRFTQVFNTPEIQWGRLAGLGREGSAVTTFPVTAPSVKPEGQSPALIYAIHTFNSGDVKVHAYFSPTLNFNGTDGLRYAISIDEEQPQIINLHEDKSNKAWEKWVADAILEKISTHNLKQPGRHFVKYWMVDSGVVLQKIVIETTGMKPSYLGPPQSYRYRRALLK